MSHNLRNPLHPALLTMALAIAMLVAVIWLATPARITQAADPSLTAPVEELAPVTVQSSTAVTNPVAQIWSPTGDAIITQKGSLTVSGFAWELGVTPPFIVDAPVLSIRRAGERSYFVNWTAVESAEYYLIEEADNPDFDEATETFVAAPTTSQPISKGIGEDGTYYYRVRATRSDLDSGRWSNVESVVIPWAATSSTSSASAPSDLLAPADALTVEVRIDGEPWQTVPMTATNWGGWTWSYLWSPLPEGQDIPYTIQARATDALGTIGPIDTITVTLKNESYVSYFPLVFKRWPPLPYTPILNAIDNPNSDGDYTVSWSYNAGSPPIPADTFTLQEATDADFTNPTTYTGIADTSKAFSGKSNGTYYYRVQANNAYGPGQWSNVVSTRVQVGFFDDFSSSGSGWPNDKGVIWQEKNPYWDVWWRRGYTSAAGTGEYYFKIDLGPAPVVWFWQPDALAPYTLRTDVYCVETEARFQSHGWWANAGLIFGADEKNTNLYMLCLGVGANQLGWHVTRNPNYTFPRNGCAYVQGIVAQGGSEGTSWNGWNKLQVSVNGNWIRVFVGGLDMGTYYMPGLSSTTRVGLVGGDYEVSGVDMRFDYLRVTPNAACTP